MNTDKIYKYLDFLSKRGHPGYKFYDDYNTYERRCLVEDPIGSKIFISEGEEMIDDLEEYLVKLKSMDEKGNVNATNENDNDLVVEEVEEVSVEEKDEEEYVKNDPVRKHQFEYNKSTCMTKLYPEADSEAILSFAPAEEKMPTTGCLIMTE